MSLELDKVLEQIDAAYAECDAEELDLRMHQIINEALTEYDKSDIRRAAVLNELGGYYRNLLKIAESEGAFLEAIEIQKALTGENNPDYATSLINLAGLYRKSGEYDKSEKLFLQAMGIYIETLPEGNYLLSSCLNNFALLYQDMERYEEAAALYTRVGLLLQGKEDPESQVGYATSLNNLATVDLKSKKFPEAESLIQAALNIYERVIGKENTLYAAVLNTQGALYFEMGNYQKSKEAYQEALDICAQKLGKDHPETLKIESRLLAAEKMLG